MNIDFRSTWNAGKLALMRHSPEILTAAGIGGMIGSAVLACLATLKVEAVTESHKQRAEAAHRETQDAATQKREITKVYLGTGAEMAKLYAPAVALGTLSVTSILAGNHILRKRNVALAAAYTAIDASYRQYRGRVQERFGEDVDRELATGGHQETIETVETDENGQEKKVKKAVTVAGNGLPSDYARYFCYGEARAAEPNADYNAFFLQAQQELANHKLRTDGLLFLNDVYEMLGIDKSVAGQAVGWVYDKDSEDHGDNWVDFGIQEVYRKRSDQPGDYEKVYLLNFNVDGPILEHAQKKGLITER